MIPNRNRFPNKRTPDNLNEGIRAQQVRAVFPDGTTQVLPTNQAIQQAKALGLDLILVSPNATPPVAKIMDFGKWTYDEKKHKHDAKRNQHIVVLKELKFRPTTDDHDYDFKRNHAVQFLKAGNKVKATVQFKGREITHADLGKALLLKLVADLKEFGEVEGHPRLEGKSAFVIIGPAKK